LFQNLLSISKIIILAYKIEDAKINLPVGIQVQHDRPFFRLNKQKTAIRLAPHRTYSGAGA